MRCWQAGASVNVFMFHGGTSFGFMNGANTDLKTGAYQPTVNSYDYDAPLAEDGSVTPKFIAMKAVILAHLRAQAQARGLPAPELPPLPPEAPRFDRQGLALAPCQPWFEALQGLTPTRIDVCPRSMEQLGQDYGFTLYRCRVRHPKGPVTLSVQAVHDRAQVFVDGRPVGLLERNGALSLALDWPGGEATLELLVENQGRVNYGPQLHDRKGLLGWVRLGINVLQRWEHFALPLAELPAGATQACEAASVQSGLPQFFSADFEVDEPGDCFVRLNGGHKGQVLDQWLQPRPPLGARPAAGALPALAAAAPRPQHADRAGAAARGRPGLERRLLRPAAASGRGGGHGADVGGAVVMDDLFVTPARGRPSLPLPEALMRFYVQQVEAGMSVTQACRHGRFSDTTFYRWRQLLAAQVPAASAKKG